MALNNDFRTDEFLDYDTYSDGGDISPSGVSYVRALRQTEEVTTKKWARITGFVLGRDKIVVDSADDDLEMQFKKSARMAFKQFGASSDLTRLFYSIGYLEVIGLGPRVVPLLLRDMRDDRRPWFFALSAITRADAAKNVNPGDIRGVIDAWLAWGKRRRFLE